MNPNTEDRETQTPSANNSEQSAKDVQALWQAYNTQQKRTEKLARPLVIGLGVVLLLLLGVTLWIVAVL